MAVVLAQNYNLFEVRITFVCFWDRIISYCMFFSLVISSIILELALGKIFHYREICKKTVLHKGISYNYMQGSMIIL